MWDCAIARVPVTLPKLNIKGKNEKDLETLLKPIKNMVLYSDSDSDCSSGIVDIFEEFHKNSFLRPLAGTKTKYLTKQEADRKTVDLFTPDFKKTMKELRDNLKLGDTLTSEDGQTIEEELSSGEKHVFFDNEKKVTVETTISVEPEVLDSETTSNSAVWNMIEAHKKTYFSTSPPQYDIYGLKPDHYLKRPHLAWGSVEESRKKCETWLDKCETE